MEQIFLEATSRNWKDRKMTGNSPNGFTKGELCLTDLITFCDEMTVCVDKKEAADVVHFDFNKICDTIPVTTV